MNAFIMPIGPERWGVFCVVNLDVICFGSGTKEQCQKELEALGGKPVEISPFALAAAA